jgi:hypothetical protein
MSAQLIIGIVAMVRVSVCGLTSTLIAFERLPEKQQFGLLGGIGPSIKS